MAAYTEENSLVRETTSTVGRTSRLNGNLRAAFDNDITC